MSTPPDTHPSSSRPLSVRTEQHGPQIQGSNQAGAGSTINQGSNNKNIYKVYYNANRDEKKKILDSVEHARGAAFDDVGVQAVKCVEGTREDLLRDIYNWAEDHNVRSESKRGFWLQGLAGTGKSTVARTVAEHLSKNGYTVASFFFRRGEEGRSSPQKFVTTILRQLAHDDELFGPLMKTYNGVGSGQKFLETEWKLFIKEPLSALTGRKIILVIDAIDESRETATAEYAMFNLLSDPENFNGLNLRVFVTARPGNKKENETFNHVFKLHDISEEIVEEDLQKYFRARFEEWHPGTDENEFPEEHHIRELARQAKPLFIAAKTSFEFIVGQGRDPEDQYRLLVESAMKPGSSFKGPQQAYVALDRMYFLVIKEALANRSPSGETFIPLASWADFRRYVGFLITLQIGLSYDALAIILDVERPRLKRFLHKFQTVLDIPQDNTSPIRVFHQSFPDFLKDVCRVRNACGAEVPYHEQLWIDPISTNSLILTRCLEIMDGSQPGISLKENICELPDSGPREDVASLGENIDPTLSYACKYWVSHFQMTDVSEDTVKMVHAFLTQHLLHWIEAMVCLDCMGDAIRQVDEIHNCVQDASHRDMKALAADLERFIRHSKEFIERSPLQIYSSALAFAPENSLVKHQFAKRMKATLVNTPLMDDEWDAKLLDFSDHKSIITKCCFSADGERIASLDQAGALFVWKAATGDVLWRADNIACIDAFLDMSKKVNDYTLAAGDVRGSVTLWTGFEKSRGYSLISGKGHNEAVESLASSPDGSRLVWVVEDGGVVVWTASCRGAAEQMPMDRLPMGFQFDRVIITDSTRNGCFVALGGYVFRKRYVAVWRGQGHGLWSFHGSFDCQTTSFIFDFVLAGTWLVSLSKSQLQFWDLTHASGHSQRVPLDDTRSGVREKLAHVPGTMYVFAPDEDGELCRYELGHPLARKKLPGSQHALMALTMSGDGKTLAGMFRLGPLEGQIGLWDISSANMDRIAVSSKNPLSPIDVPMLSVNATSIALCTGTRISLFDRGLLGLQGARQTQTPKQNRGPLGTSLALEDAGESVRGDPALSPDGTLAACATVAVADEGQLEGRGRLLSATFWKLDSGARHSFPINFTAGPGDFGRLRLLFSPDSKRLAMIKCNLQNSRIWIASWHVNTGRREGLGTIRGSLVDSCPAVFSLDSQLLSFAFQDTKQIPNVAILDLRSAASPELIIHPFPEARPGDLALGVSPAGPRIFCAALTKNISESYPPIQVYTYSWSSVTPTSKMDIPELVHERPDAVALSTQSTPPMIAIRDDYDEITVCLLSNRQWYFRKLPRIFQAKGLSFDGHLSLCQEGTCLSVSHYGVLQLDLHRQSQPTAPCPCGSLPVFKEENNPWILFQQRPLLRLPNHLASSYISEANGTILICDNESKLLHWIRLNRGAP